MGETHSQHVAKVAQSHEDGEGPGTGAVTEHVGEEETSDDDFGLDEGILGDGGEVGDVGEYVEGGDEADGERRGEGKGAAGVLDFGKDVVCVFPALVTVDDSQESRRVGVHAAASPPMGVRKVKGILEVLGVLDP